MSEIRIVTAPSIYVIGRQEVDADELARFLADNDAAGWESDAPSAGEKLGEISGRLCYQSFKKPRPGGNRAYLAHIIESGHGRVLEHAVWTLLVTGISRSFAQELYTHVAGMSKSMLSQRFVDESDCAFVVPPALIAAVNYFKNTQPADNTDIPGWSAGATWVGACRDAAENYRRLAAYLEAIGPLGDEDRTARRKAAREAARSVLPSCVETKVCLTGNARAFRNFIEARGSAGADAEIRRFSLQLLGVLRAEAPNTFADYTTPTVDGVTVIQTPHRKV